MGTSAQIAITSGIFSLFFIVLFSIESRRGVRFGESLRSVLDSLIERTRAVFREYVPEINSLFVQELFYYVLHLSLSRVLGMVRAMERFMLRVVRFNRMQAQKLRMQAKDVAGQESGSATGSNPHLAQIAEHKKSTELTEKEKIKRKEASIENSGPR